MKLLPECERYLIRDLAEALAVQLELSSDPSEWRTVFAEHSAILDAAAGYLKGLSIDLPQSVALVVAQEAPSK